METRTIGSVLIIIIFIALFVYFFLRYIFREEIFDPFSEKTRLVRYYACSMAICTRGCGNEMLSEAGCSSKHGCICLERDPGTKECKKWCQDICDENNWPDGTYCDENHFINISLKESVNLKGAYYLWGNEEDSWETETQDIITNLNKTESFPGINDLLWGNEYNDQNENSYRWSDRCSDRFTKSYQNSPPVPDSPQSTLIAWGFGLINQVGAGFTRDGVPYDTIEGGGDIVLDPTQATEFYSCVRSNVPGCSMAPALCSRGFYSCTFNGILKIWSFNKTSYPTGCADVSFRAVETSQGDFILWPDPDTKTIPIKQQDSFQIKITNNLDSDQPQPFDLSIESLKEANCKLDKTSIDIAKADTQFVTMTCNPTQFPPNGQDSYTVVITANGGGITHITKVDVIVSDFTINITPDETKTVNVGNSLIYTVGIDNRLGIPADFALSLSPDSGAGCTLPVDSLHVENGKFKTITMTCTPTRVGTHEVTVYASYETIEHNATIEIDVHVCNVNSLDLEFLRSEYPTTNVNSGDDFDIRVNGFDGCQGYNINLYVSPGLDIGTCTVDTSGTACRITKTAGTPGVYEFNATMVVGRIEYNVSNTLTINKPSVITSDCKKRNEWCVFSLGSVDCNGAWFGGGADICDKCGSWGSVENCKNYGDPQSCYMDPTGGCTEASNICCIHDSDYYSAGPKDGPSCLSTDTNTHNDKTQNFWYWGVDNGRNILLVDREYAIFNYNDCGSNDDCNGKSGGANPPSSLSSAVCVNKRCQLSNSLPTYTSWLYIKISESSRPVYGVVLKGENDGGCGGFSVFLHDNSGWFDIGDAGLNQWVWYTASPKWSYDNVDSILIAKNDNCNPRFSSVIDYIGLLTKDGKTPFCNYGTGDFQSSNDDYKRTVDDGKICYWGLNCPQINSNGWGWDKSSSRIGPLKDVGCDCSGGSCGNGYCEFSDMNGNRFCYYNVMCMNGGWNGNIEKCDTGTCSYNGCM